ncbi:hypothetical protein [Arthrobacter pigmenti]
MTTALGTDNPFLTPAERVEAETEDELTTGFYSWLIRQAKWRAADGVGEFARYVVGMVETGRMHRPRNAAALKVNLPHQTAYYQLLGDAVRDWKLWLGGAGTKAGGWPW